MKIQQTCIFVLISLLLLSCGGKNSDTELKIDLEKIISKTNADIGLSIMVEQHTGIAVNGDKRYPMMSTVKFPVALAILSKVEKGELSLSQQLLISKEELLENTWSPFRDDFPSGNATISLEEALIWMVVKSDNNITDVLIRLAGGEEYIEKFIDTKDIIIRNNEKDMHQDWDSQFINKASPNAYVDLLKAFSEGQILNEENTEWLYQAMVKSTTGVNRLKGKLPDVEIAQRAGTSFTNDEGITGAINNSGIIKLPDNRRIYISVFIKDIKGFEKGEELIADIGKTVYDHYTRK